MLYRLRYWTRYFFAWLLFRVAASFGLMLVPVASMEYIGEQLAGAEQFMERSGFLRDGRYPGGRQAERKLHGGIVRARLEADFARITPAQVAIPSTGALASSPARFVTHTFTGGR